MRKLLFVFAIVLMGTSVSLAFSGKIPNSNEAEQYVKCPKCNGYRFLVSTCRSCNGRGGNESYTYQNCRACKGAGSIQELGGYIDGKPYYVPRKCSNCNGEGREKAGREWHPCSTCSGTGEIKHTCSYCNGTGTVRRQ